MKNTVEWTGNKYYGNDEIHALSAWTSTSRYMDDGKRARVGDLLKMLGGEGHHSPFEKSLLHFLVRVDTATHIHLLKHRIGVSCLAGNTKLQFLNSNGDSTPRYAITIRELHARWNRGRAHQNTSKDVLYQRRRLSGMRLSCLGLTSGLLEPVSVVDVLHQGVKETFRYESESGKSIVCTPDHLFRAYSGEWISIERAFMEGTPVVGVGHCGGAHRSQDLRMTTPVQWRDVPGTSGTIRVSDRGDVESRYNNRHVSNVFRPKKQVTTRSGYRAVSIPGGKLRHVHRLVLEAFVGPRPNNQECRHLDNNKENNHLCNLVWGTSSENKEDFGIAGSPRRRAVSELIVRKSPEGTQDVYDLTVAGEDHAFLADGFLVHNCNGESARYKELGVPTALIPEDWPEALQRRLQLHHDAAVQEYKDALRELTPIIGRARAKESARFFLPYSNQITLDVCFNWRSFHHFLSLRKKPNAQKEVREIASTMLEMVRELPDKPFERTIAAFGY